MTRVTHGGIQIAPTIHDERAQVTRWSIILCADADTRTKSAVFTDLAGELIIERDPT